MIVVGKATKKFGSTPPIQKLVHRPGTQDFRIHGPRIPIVDSQKKTLRQRWKIWGGQPVPQRIWTSELFYELATPWRHSIVGIPRIRSIPTKERLSTWKFFHTTKRVGGFLFIQCGFFLVGLPPKNACFHVYMFLKICETVETWKSLFWEKSFQTLTTHIWFQIFGKDLTTYITVFTHPRNGYV